MRAQASHNTTDPWLKFHVLVSATVNFTIIFTYASMTTHSLSLTFHAHGKLMKTSIIASIRYVFKFERQPYFAYVLLPSIGLLCFHLLMNNYWGVMPRPHKLFYIHLLAIFAPLNLILFTVFLTTSPNEAWFVFPLLLTAIPMMSHYVVAFHPDDAHKWFYIDVITASCLGGLAFLLW